MAITDNGKGVGFNPTPT